MARVLVIDDSASVYYSVRAALTPDGYAVERLDCFIDLPAAIVDPPALVLLDLNIPALPGVKIGRYIRGRAPSYVPILIYSGAPFGILRAAMAEIGADGCVSKSSGLDALRVRVRQLARVAPPSSRRAMAR